jgi:hypothetical protein
MLVYIYNKNQGILKGKYHCTVDLLFDWLGISCMTTDNFFAKQTSPNQSNRRSTIQIYFPFSIPWFLL